MAIRSRRIKTEADWERWSEFRERGEAASKSPKPGGKLVDQAKREFLRQYTNREMATPVGGMQSSRDGLPKRVIQRRKPISRMQRGHLNPIYLGKQKKIKILGCFLTK